MKFIVTLMIIICALLFCTGVVFGILSVIFTIKKKHPVAAIILAIVCWFGISVAVNMTAGALIGGIIMVLLGAFVGVIIAKSMKIIKQNKK